jgi:hypothetical protein
MERLYWLALSVLGVWRITHLLHAEDGPGSVLVRLRRLAGPRFWGKLLDCFYCLSLWVAAPFAIIVGGAWVEKLLLWPALSGAAILLERWLERCTAATPAYAEDPPKEEKRSGT